MKYCTLKDRPLAGLTISDQNLPGCEVYGVHHDCGGCPNLIEMGKANYSFSNEQNSPTA